MLVEGITLNEIHSLILFVAYVAVQKIVHGLDYILKWFSFVAYVAVQMMYIFLDCSVKSQVFLMARSPKISLIHCHILTLLSSL